MKAQEKKTGKKFNLRRSYTAELVSVHGESGRQLYYENELARLSKLVLFHKQEAKSRSQERRIQNIYTETKDNMVPCDVEAFLNNPGLLVNLDLNDLENICKAAQRSLFLLYRQAQRARCPIKRHIIEIVQEALLDFALVESKGQEFNSIKQTTLEKTKTKCVEEIAHTKSDLTQIENKKVTVMQNVRDKGQAITKAGQKHPMILFNDLFWDKLLEFVKI